MQIALSVFSHDVSLLADPGINAINLGRTAAAEIYSAIERTPAIDGTDEKGMKLGDKYDGSITLKNVVFAYPSRPQDVIFSNFDLNVKSGQSLALVGPSGSGKSSLSKLGGGATDEEVEAAARAASAHEFIIELPDRYDTFYSGSSIQLSGGQIQRISIARALIRQPKILLLGKFVICNLC